MLELQEIDSAVDRLQHRREQLVSGQDLRAARVAQEEAESRLGELRLALDGVSQEQTRLEHEIDSMSQKAAAEEKRMYDGSIVNTRELESLQAEVASLRGRTSRAEDDMLERMERREELEARLAEAEAEVAEARSRTQQVGQDVDRELGEIEADLARHTGARSEIVPAVDEELLELYEDIRRQKKGIAAVALVDGVCQGCHEKLSALELDKLKRTVGVKRCEYCRRIVIFA